MGEPKATDMPAAAAAERTSLFRAVSDQLGLVQPKCCRLLTLITIYGAEKFHEQIRTTARNVY